MYIIITNGELSVNWVWQAKKRQFCVGSHVNPILIVDAVRPTPIGIAHCWQICVNSSWLGQNRWAIAPVLDIGVDLYFGTPAVGINEPLLTTTKIQWALVMPHGPTETNIIIKQLVISMSSIESLYFVFHWAYLRLNMTASWGFWKKTTNRIGFRLW